MSNSTTRSIDLSNQGRGKLEQGVNYLLAIGIDNYQKAPELHNAVRDAKAFVEVLTTQYKFDKDNVKELYNGEANRHNIFDSFRALVRKASPNDNVVIYFSGHGSYDKELEEGFWLPVGAEIGKNYDYISNKQIVTYVKAIKSRHTLLVVDSCFSGALFVERDMIDVQLEESIPSRWAITSGRQEPVMDGQPGDHSPFADNLLFFLKNNTNPFIPIIELVEKVKRAVASNVTQLPRGAVIHGVGDKGGQFFFHKKRDEAADWKKTLEQNTVNGYRYYLEMHPAGEHLEAAKAKLKTLEEEELWSWAKSTNTIPAFLKYERTYPGGKYIAEAMEAIAALEEASLWQSVSLKDSIPGYRKYLQKYPEGKYAEKASARLEAKYQAYESKTDEPEIEKKEAPKKEPEKQEESEKVYAARPIASKSDVTEVSTSSTTFGNIKLFFKNRIPVVALTLLVLIIIMGGCSNYNKFVALENDMENAWSTVMNSYQRRNDLIPNLINTIKTEPGFKKEALTQVVEARANSNSVGIDPGNLTAEVMQKYRLAQEGIATAINRMLVAVEDFPDLKSNQDFLEMRTQLEGIDNRISVNVARFNDRVTSYNKKISSFPSILYASILGFKEIPTFQ